MSTDIATFLETQPAMPAVTKPADTAIAGAPYNTILHGDCVQILHRLSARSVNFVLTDPPYLARYRGRDVRRVPNDDNDAWLKPVFAEIFRVLADDTFAVSFYGWPHVDRFMAAWRSAGFRIAGHLVFPKRYLDDAASALPDWTYSGNRLHPTQKPLGVLLPPAEAEAGLAQRGGDVLVQWRGEGEHDGFLTFIAQTGLAGEGTTAERAPLGHLVLVVDPVTQRQQRAIERVAVEIEQADFVARPPASISRRVRALRPASLSLASCSASLAFCCSCARKRSASERAMVFPYREKMQHRDDYAAQRLFPGVYSVCLIHPRTIGGGTVVPGSFV